METIKGFTRYLPEMRYTSNGVAITNFTLYDTQEDAYSKKSRVTTWELLAESCNRLIENYDEVYAKGYWKERSWITPDGKTKTINEFTAKQVWLFKDNQFTEIKGELDDSKEEIPNPVVAEALKMGAEIVEIVEP